MKKQPKPYILYLGIVIFAVGLLMKALVPEADGPMQALPFVLMGFGAGIIGVGVAGVFRKRMIDNDPEKAKRYEIEEKDERNIRVREKAGYATWYTSLFILTVLSLVFVVLGYTIPAFMTIGALVLHALSLFVYIYVYNKKI